MTTKPSRPPSARARRTVRAARGMGADRRSCRAAAAAGLVAWSASSLTRPRARSAARPARARVTKRIRRSGPRGLDVVEAQALLLGAARRARRGASARTGGCVGVEHRSRRGTSMPSGSRHGSLISTPPPERLSVVVSPALDARARSIGIDADRDDGADARPVAALDALGSRRRSDVEDVGARALSTRRAVEALDAARRWCSRPRTSGRRAGCARSSRTASTTVTRAARDAPRRWPAAPRRTAAGR